MKPPRHDLKHWNIRDIVRALMTKEPSIKRLYLFGSRAYGTNSFRSDIDLLAICERPLVAAVLTSWLHEEFPPVDLFESPDNRVAKSLINGSGIIIRGEAGLAEQLDAIELWSAAGGFSTSFDRWDQFTLIDATFAWTILPLAPSVVSLAANFTRRLADEGFPSVFLGSSWDHIGQTLGEVVDRALGTPTHFALQATTISRKSMVLASEFDFQNLIHLVIRPWLPNLERENVVITYADRKKSADFGLERNAIVIEAKHIKNADDERAVIKDLAGLKDFYLRHPNVRLLLFWILVNPGISINEDLLTADYSDLSHSPIVMVRFFKNTLMSAAAN